MKAIYTGLLFLSLVGYALSAACSNTDAVIEMDYNGASKHGAPMKDLSCNAQTQIDFGFGQPASGQLNTTLNTSTQYATFVNFRLCRTTTIAGSPNYSFWTFKATTLLTHYRDSVWSPTQQAESTCRAIQ